MTSPVGVLVLDALRDAVPLDGDPNDNLIGLTNGDLSEITSLPYKKVKSATYRLREQRKIEIVGKLYSHSGVGRAQFLLCLSADAHQARQLLEAHPAETADGVAEVYRG